MTTAAVPPWRQLTPLTLAVLAAHAFVLQWQAQGLVQPGADAARGFVTRTIAAAPAPVTPAPPPPSAAPPRAAAAPNPARHHVSPP